MSFKQRIPMLLFITTFAVWAISLMLVYLPISPWSGPVFPKTVDAVMLDIFLTTTVLAFTAALAMGFHSFFYKRNIEANGENLVKTKSNRDV